MATFGLIEYKDATPECARFMTTHGHAKDGLDQQFLRRLRTILRREAHVETSNHIGGKRWTR